MADGIFASLVSRTRDANSASNVIYTQLADNGGNAVTVTGNKLDVNASVTLETAYVDDTAFSIGSDKVNAQGYLADETATDSVDEGDIGLARMTLDRRMITSSEQSGTWDIGTVTTLTGITNDVSISDGGNSITVDNAALSVVGGGAEATALRVTIANDSTGLLSIDDGGGSITVDGSVTVSATDLDIRDLDKDQDEVLIWANTSKDGTGTDYVPLVDADGKLIISNPGGTAYTEDVAAPAAATGTANVAERDDVLGGITPAEGDWSKFYVNANGALWVKHDGDITISDGGNTITVDGTVAATQSGVWNIGTVSTLTGITNDVNIADGGNSITVDNAALSVVGGGTEAAALRVTIANDSTGLLSIDDNGGSITVDGSVTVSATDLDIRDLTHASDSVKIGDGTEFLAVNTDGSINVNIVSAVITGEIHDYDKATAIASDASDNHDYAVANSTFLLKSVILAGSGNIKAEIQVGPVASLVTKAVMFLTGRQGDTQQIFFDPAIEVPVAASGTVRVIRTNRQGAATDLYSTIIGIDQ